MVLEGANMKLQTASEVINFAEKLEDESAKFYEDLSKRYTESKEIFLSFAKENGKNTMQIERAYYGVISDALEGCFAFNMDPEECTFQTKLAEKASYSDALNRAIEIEEKTLRFYSNAAEQSRPLIPDVARVFGLIAKKRSQRILQLKSLLN